ncbi:MAG: dicarboxylate/amino acid:cation symporter [Elusimicrobia bacterium]|nr:dicarboxylate/amino acid:cation symporter [Elusimicrobiota bacterium]
MLVGAAVGAAVGPGAAPLGILGTLVIQLIKTAAAPLLFLAIVQAIVKTEVSGKDGARMMAAAAFNASVALAIGLALSNLLHPGTHLEMAGLTAPGTLARQEPLSFARMSANLIPTSIVEPFLSQNILGVVILALFLGAGLRAANATAQGEAARGLAVFNEMLAGFLTALEFVLGWIVALVPLAVFGVVAKAVGEYGFSPLKGLAAYVGVALLGFAIHTCVTYQLWVGLFARIPLRRFWSEARETLAYAFGTNSSLATLPLTLRTLDRLGVSRKASALGACVGTNLNNDGIILYEGMALLFVAQAHGIHLDLGQQLMAAASCMVAAMGIAGIPEAGFVSLSIVLATVGLPVELLPLLLTVDWLVARGRSVMNVLSDMVVSIIIDRADKGGADA